MKRTTIVASSLLLLASPSLAGAVACGGADVPRPVYDAEPGYVEMYHKAWELAEKRIRFSKGLPTERYMDEALCEADIWIWDSSFMAFFCKYAPKDYPGIETLDNFYTILLNKDEVPLPKVVCDVGWAKEKRGELTPLSVHRADNPPIMGWAEVAYAKYTGDRARLRKVLVEKRWLQRYFEFVENIRPNWRTDGIRIRTYAEKTSDGYHWNGCASGMDNTPRGRRGARCEGVLCPDDKDLLWLDLLAQQGLAAKSIAEGFDILGDTAAAAQWRAKYEEKKALLNLRYWDARDGFYYDVFGGDLSFCRIVTPASFWPLEAGMATSEQARRVAAYVADGGPLAVRAGVATLAKDDPDFTENGDYWRGSMWLPTSYMTVKSLEKYGMLDLARELARRTVAHQYATYTNAVPHTIWECYKPNRPEPARTGNGKDTVTPDFCGWSALGPISLFIENVIGLWHVDAFRREVRWHLPKDAKGRVGVENFRFGDVTCDLVLDGGKVAVVSSAPFTLWLDDRRVDVAKGRQAFDVAVPTVAKGAFRIRDPFVLADGGRYYLYEVDFKGASYDTGREVYVRESADLERWTDRKPVLTLPAGADCRSLWAPEVHQFGGSYWMFVTLTQSPGAYPVAEMPGVGAKNLSPRGTWVFKSASPCGPFAAVKEGPVPPRELMTLDGTLYVEDGTPYMAYCHEWCQLGNGTIEYAPLTPDFASFAAAPKPLLSATGSVAGAGCVTDGVFFWRSEKSGRLYLIWSNFVEGRGYCVLIRRSESGRIAGPWSADRLLYDGNGGHGMIFRDFGGGLRLALHQPQVIPDERLLVLELADDGEWLTLVRPAVR